MTGPSPDEAMREAAREVLGDLMRGLVDDAAPPRVKSHEHDASIPNRPSNVVPHANGDGNYVEHVDAQANPIGHASDGASRRPSSTSDDAVIVPQVPAPPVAAVLRPSTWSGPAGPGEVIGDHPPDGAKQQQRSRSSGPGSPPAPVSDVSTSRLSTRAAAAAGADSRLEPVTIDSDDDLQRFVQALVGRLENPRDRQAIRGGRLRFSLRRSPATPAAAGTAQVATRVVKGAVTERAVLAAVADGTRLVLARGAVLTPLARDCARARGVKIDRERTC